MGRSSVLHKNNPTYSFLFEGFSFQYVETRTVIAVSNPVHLFRWPCIVICGLSDCTKFSTISNKGTTSGNILLNVKCLLWFSLQILVWNIYLSKKNSVRYYKKMYIGLHVKYPLFVSDFNESWILHGHPLPQKKETCKCKFSWKCFRREARCSMRTDEQTELIVSFRNFANTPKTHLTQLRSGGRIPLWSEPRIS